MAKPKRPDVEALRIEYSGPRNVWPQKDSKRVVALCNHILDVEKDLEKAKADLAYEREARQSETNRAHEERERAQKAEARVKELEDTLQESRPFVESSPLYGGQGYMTDKIDGLLNKSEQDDG